MSRFRFGRWRLVDRPGGLFDPLSLPYLIGLDYFIVFGLAAIDAIYDWGHSSYRLRTEFIDFHSVSASALAHVWVGYFLFVFGYFLPAGKKAARLINRISPFIAHRSLTRRRVAMYTIVLFGLSVPLLVSATQRFGAGRLAGAEEFDPAFSTSYVASQFSFVIYALSVWRLMLLWRDGKSARLYAVFVGLMFAVELGYATLQGSRSTLATMLLVALLAYHYGYRRITFRAAATAAVLLVIVMVPIIGWYRDAADVGSARGSDDSALTWSWNSVMTHYSALEGYTVTFEHLSAAPAPDPLSEIFSSGLIPRALWPDKPFSTWGKRFSSWAAGLEYGAFFPTLPGEMLLHFGYAGALASMMMLGMLWRTLFLYFVDLQKDGLGFVYVLLVPQTVTQLEIGFVVPYGALLRMMLMCFLVFFVVTRSRALVVRPLEPVGAAAR